VVVPEADQQPLLADDIVHLVRFRDLSQKRGRVGDGLVHGIESRRLLQPIQGFHVVPAVKVRDHLLEQGNEAHEAVQEHWGFGV
jgi:hypothetical protein